jgi:hypothetical protein
MTHLPGTPRCSGRDLTHNALLLPPRRSLHQGQPCPSSTTAGSGFPMRWNPPPLQMFGVCRNIPTGRSQRLLRGRLSKTSTCHPPVHEIWALVSPTLGITPMPPHVSKGRRLRRSPSMLADQDIPPSSRTKRSFAQIGLRHNCGTLHIRADGGPRFSPGRQQTRDTERELLLNCPSEPELNPF